MIFLFVLLWSIVWFAFFFHSNWSMQGATPANVAALSQPHSRMVIINTCTFETFKPPLGKYELLFSDSGFNAMLFGITAEDEEVQRADTDMFDKHLHTISGELFLYDVLTGKNQKLSVLQSRSKLATPRISERGGSPGPFRFTALAVFTLDVLPYVYRSFVWCIDAKSPNVKSELNQHVEPFGSMRWCKTFCYETVLIYTSCTFSFVLVVTVCFICIQHADRYMGWRNIAVRFRVAFAAWHRTDYGRLSTSVLAVQRLRASLK